tara:strand:+ start:2822 stop:3046 length:225 start_codon:yes stop_codon:yes gene_type:complete
MEYVIGPVLALLLGMKFTDYKLKESAVILKNLEEKITLIEKQVSLQEQELPKKVIATMVPIAQAVKELNQTVGL